jgi:PhnB protein
MKMDSNDGAVMHAEVKIRDSIIMMGEASEKSTPMPAMLYLYVDDADKYYDSGNIWWISTHVEDVPFDELEKRQKEMKK